MRDNEYRDNRSFTGKDHVPKHGPGRHAMSDKVSQKQFTKHALLTHRKNVPSRLPMRGGIRL